MNPDELSDLQTRVAFQEREIETMSDVMYQQQKRMDLLEQQLAYLRTELKRLRDEPEGASAFDQGDQPPPHY